MRAEKQPRPRSGDERGIIVKKMGSGALFVGLNMADLAAIGAFTWGPAILCGGTSPTTTTSCGRVWRGVRSRGVLVIDALLLVAGNSTVFVAFQTDEFFLKPNLMSLSLPLRLRRREGTDLCWLRLFSSSSAPGLMSDNLIWVSFIRR